MAPVSGDPIRAAADRGAYGPVAVGVGVGVGVGDGVVGVGLGLAAFCTTLSVIAVPGGTRCPAFGSCSTTVPLDNCGLDTCTTWTFVKPALFRLPRATW